MREREREERQTGGEKKRETKGDREKGRQRERERDEKRGRESDIESMYLHRLNLFQEQYQTKYTLA